MATLQELLGGGLPAGLLSPEQEAAAERRAQNAALLNFAFGALQASRGQPGQAAPSLGQVIGQAGPVGVQAYQQSFDQTLANTLRGMQVAELKKKQETAELIKRAMPNVFRQEVVSPGQFGRGLSMADPAAQMMARQNAELAGEQGLSMLEASANYPVQGTSQEQFLQAPQTRTTLNQSTLASLRAALPPKEYRDLVGGLKEELEILQPKADFLTVGNAVYVKDPKAPNGLKIVVDNTGTLSGEYGNLAKLLYGTENVSQLPAGAADKIIAQINKKAGLEGGLGPEGLGKSGMGKVDEALINSGSRVITLNRIAQGFDPRFLETKFRLGMSARGLGEKLGRELSTQERAELTAYTQFRQDSVRQLNQYINEVTGAAIGQGEEADRLKAGVPNPGSGLFDGDGPTEFAAKLQNTLKDLKMAEARLHYIKTKGLKLTDVSLTSMPRIMKDREAELIKQLRLDPNKQEDRNVLINRLAQEFGLLQ
jgi:hypothetical protein